MGEWQYLVVLSHTMDEIPLRLCDDSDEAFEFARAASWEVPEGMGRILELPDCNTPCVISIWAFKDGVPHGRVIVRDYDDEMLEEDSQ